MVTEGCFGSVRLFGGECMWGYAILVLAWLAVLIARLEAADRERNERSRASIDRILHPEGFMESRELKSIADRPSGMGSQLVAVHRKANRASRTMARGAGVRVGIQRRVVAR